MVVYAMLWLSPIFFFTRLLMFVLKLVDGGLVSYKLLIFGGEIYIFMFRQIDKSLSAWSDLVELEKSYNKNR